MPTETIEIDGRLFWTLAEFYDYIGPMLYDDDWGRNLDAFNDILRGGPVTLRWTHSALSRERLGGQDV